MILGQVACGDAGEPGEQTVIARPPAPPVDAMALQPDPADTVALRITLEEPSCLPGVCRCRGTTDRSTGLWRIGVEDRELDQGVRCVGADFDGNGDSDLALLGGEGRAAAVMYSGGRPASVVEFEAGGLIELYEPREIVGSRGEPASTLPGLFVQYVGQNHLVLLWDGASFERILVPVS